MLVVVLALVLSFYESLYVSFSVDMQISFTTPIAERCKNERLRSWLKDYCRLKDILLGLQVKANFHLFKFSQSA